MNKDSNTVIELEKKFWKSLLDQDADTAVDLLTEPAFMVSPMGAMKFDHADYRRMVDQGSMVVKSYELGEIDAEFPSANTAVLSYSVTQVLTPRDKQEDIRQQMKDTSTWVRDGGTWKCAMHTETPVDKKAG